MDFINSIVAATIYNNFGTIRCFVPYNMVRKTITITYI